MKYISLVAIWLLLLSSNTFALTYDPETNTYIDDTPQQTQTTTPASNEDSTSDTENVSEIQEEETTNTQNESSISSTSSSSKTYTWPLMALHQLLDQYSAELQDHIGDTYMSLQETIATSSDTIALQQRLDVLECVGVIDDEFSIVDDIKNTQKQLRTKIRVVVADTHSEIEALETKIDQNLLDQFEENLEIAVVQNKVESLLTEYTNVVDTYYDLSIDEIDQLENDIATNNKTYQTVINNYDSRKQLLQDLEQDYEEFNKKSSFVGVVVWPSLWDVNDALDEIKRFYRIKFMSAWSDEVGSHITNDVTQYQNEARARFNRAFNEYINSLIDDIYPLQEIERINQELLTIRAAYTYDNGELDCRGLATNPVIESSATALQTSMNSLLSKINAWANMVATDSWKLPTSTKELEKQFVEYAQWFVSQEQNVLLRDEKSRVQSLAWTSRSVSTVRTQRTRRETTVREFLLTQYEQALASDRMSKFEDKLQRALNKIPPVKAAVEWRTLEMIEVIEAVIREFI